MPHIERIKEFCSIIDNMQLMTFYQSIYDLKTGDVIGYEARSAGGEDSHFGTFESLQKMANILERNWDLEIVSKTNALKQAIGHIDNKKLFLHVDPHNIYDIKDGKSYIKSLIRALGVNQENVIIQVSEKGLEENSKEFFNVIEYYQSLGFSIAVDMVYNIHMGQKNVSQARPKYVKLDRRLIENIDSDMYKQNVVNSFIQIANNNFVKTIAVGISTFEQLKTVIMLGVDYVQGELLCDLTDGIPDESKVVKDDIVSYYNKILEQGLSYEDNIYIKSLVNETPTIENHMICEDVRKYFQTTKANTLVVMDGDKPAGLVAKDNFDSFLSTRYGFSLYCKKPITRLMDFGTVILDEFTPVYSAAQQALRRDEEQLYNDIIVTRKSKYLGTVTMKSIINYTINYEKNKAIELNPLTALPGNIAVDKNLKKILRKDCKYGFFYLDIDNFKGFNNLYGFRIGDKVIKMLAKILLDSVKSYTKVFTFVGHMGGDDFVFIIDSDLDGYISTCENINKEFEKRILEFYKEKDIKNGYLSTRDKDGNIKKVPLISLSIAGVYGKFSRFSDPDDIYEYIAMLRGEAKKKKGSSYLINEIK